MCVLPMQPPAGCLRKQQAALAACLPAACLPACWLPVAGWLVLWLDGGAGCQEAGRPRGRLLRRRSAAAPTVRVCLGGRVAAPTTCVMATPSSTALDPLAKHRDLNSSAAPADRASTAVQPDARVTPNAQAALGGNGSGRILHGAKPQAGRAVLMLDLKTKEWFTAPGALCMLLVPHWPVSVGSVQTVSMRATVDTGWIPWAHPPRSFLYERLDAMRYKGRNNLKEKLAEDYCSQILQSHDWRIRPDTPFAALEQLVAAICVRNHAMRLLPCED